MAQKIEKIKKNEAKFGVLNTFVDKNLWRFGADQAVQLLRFITMLRCLPDSISGHKRGAAGAFQRGCGEVQGVVDLAVE